MKVQSIFYPDFISKTDDILLISSFITKNAQIIDIWCIYAVDSREKCRNLRTLEYKIFSLKIWLCKILDKYHVCQSFKVNNEKGNLANWTGCLMPPTDATAPACIVDPSIMEASISTWPNTFFVVPVHCCTWDPYLQSVLTLGLRWRLLNPPSPSQQPNETPCTIKKWNRTRR